jgi:hypothetical protein
VGRVLHMSEKRNLHKIIMRKAEWRDQLGDLGVDGDYK